MNTHSFFQGPMAQLIVLVALSLFCPAESIASNVGNTDLAPGVTNATLAPYLAKGTGGSCGPNDPDDTNAIQSALNDTSSAGGGIVFLPTGRYCIKSHLYIHEHTTLQGVYRAPATTAKFNPTTLIGSGTVLLAVENADLPNGVAFITLDGNSSTLDGVVIYYPNQVAPLESANSWSPIGYPWTISGGPDVVIQNILLVNPFQGIDLMTNGFGTGRHLVRGIYGQPLWKGIAVDRSYDVGRILDVHFWPFWCGADTTLNSSNLVRQWVQRNGWSFQLYRADWEVVQDIFSLGYHVALSFSDNGNGGTNGQMSNINFDSAGVGIGVYATQDYAVHITNLNVAATSDTTEPRRGIWNFSGSGAGNLNVKNATFWGPMYQAILWEKPGLLMIDGARIQSTTSGVPAISITGGRAMIQNNAFENATTSGVAVSVGSGAAQVIVSGNMLLGKTVQVSNSTTIVANNLP